MSDEICKKCKVNSYCGLILSCEKAMEIYQKGKVDAIIEFLTFCREHADEYDDDGWSLADLIELNIRFEKEQK